MMGECVYLLVPVYNRRMVTARLAALLRDQTYRDFRLWLIDDGSTDGTAEAVQAILPDAVVIRGEGSWWWAGCLERGCEELARKRVDGSAIIGLLNDDVEISADFLAAAVGEVQRHPDSLVLAKQVDARTGALIDGGGGVHADLERLHFSAASGADDINCLPTRGLFLRRADLERAGRFRPKLLPHYLSDYEFTLRAQRCGLALHVASTFSVGVQQAKTGIGQAELFRTSRSSRIRLLFSNRCKENPLTWLAFVSIATPRWGRPRLLIKVIGRALLLMARCAFEPVRTNEQR